MPFDKKKFISEGVTTKPGIYTERTKEGQAKNKATTKRWVREADSKWTNDDDPQAFKRIKSGMPTDQVTPGKWITK